MSGAIVIDGIEQYVVELRRMTERVLILRDSQLQHGVPTSTLLKRGVELSPYHSRRGEKRNE